MVTDVPSGVHEGAAPEVGGMAWVKNVVAKDFGLSAFLLNETRMSSSCIMHGLM